MMMKLATLMLIFPALAASLPSDVGEVATWGHVLPAGKIDIASPKVSLAEVTATDLEQAHAKVTSLLQEGKDANACAKMAHTALDEVTAAVKIQQDALDEMDKGANCDAAGDTYMADAKLAEDNAAAALKLVNDTLAAAQSTVVDLGTYKWSELNPDSCKSLFDISAFTSVTTAVNEAQNAVVVAQDALNAATKGVKDAVQVSADLVADCKCKVVNEQEAALEKFNADAKEINTKTWNQAKLMQCVLNGTSERQCSLGSIPVVTESSLAEGVGFINARCSFKATLGAKSNVPPRDYLFRLGQVDPNGGRNFNTQMKLGCSKFGMLPVCAKAEYCEQDANAMYLGNTDIGNTGILAGSINVDANFPSGWDKIKEHFYGFCYYAGIGRVLDKAMCNNDKDGIGNIHQDSNGQPSTKHRWLSPSETQGTGKDGKPNEARFFMCAKIVHKPFTVDLGAMNGVPAQKVEFKMITAMDGAKGYIGKNMVKDCKAIGMKPVCDIANDCKTDPDSFYVGQTSHFASPSHRRDVTKFPAGWQKFVDNYYPQTRGMCAYNWSTRSPQALCDSGTSHAWKTSAQVHEFMCAKKVD